MNPKLTNPLILTNALPDDYLVYLAAAAAAAGIFVLFVVIRLAANARSSRMQARMEMIRSDGVVGELRRRRPAGRMAQLDESFENLLTHTGLDLTPDRAIAWMIFVGSLLGVAAFLLSSELWLGIVGLALGVAVVFVALLFYRTRYRTLLQDQLPDGIALMARALRSGLSLEQAVSLVGQECSPPLANEFKKCDAQVKLGMSVHEAVESMARQLQIVDLNALASTIAVAEAAGGNLPLLLDRLAASARDRAHFRAYFRAATALARISVVPIALMVPMLVIAYFLWTPSYAFTFMNSPNAPLVIGAAILIEFIGLYWIYWLLRFDY